MRSRFEQLREKHPAFHYHGYEIRRNSAQIVLQFHFSIENLCEFRPETAIDLEHLPLCNDPQSPLARELVFVLGLAEVASYWKSTCSPVIKVHCGALSQGEISWWKRLWYHGLGEFFYRNEIVTDIESFVQVECDGVPSLYETDFHAEDISLVPVGGGKDSCVTLQLLKEQGLNLMGFTVNDLPARSETFAAAGFAPEQMLRTHRMIDPALLRRNAEGCWNGHTPFSAIVAFLGLYNAYLIGAGELVLSNEASANEPSVPGTDINHQYSKSYAFEQDMNGYITRRFGLPIRYFSLLRPFHELQIAKCFSSLPQYHFAFRSCNAGSRQNIWCCSCAKCLFVYLMLAPFLPRKRLDAIFGQNLLESAELRKELRELLGENKQKPFECVGTIDEARAAFDGLKGDNTSMLRMLREINHEHSIPERFMPAMERMFNDVSAIG